jgi:hypothetical protein
VSVVINEFEVVPAPPEPTQAQQPAAAEPPAAAIQLEVERAVTARHERELRLRAD